MYGIIRREALVDPVLAEGLGHPLLPTMIAEARSLLEQTREAWRLRVLAIESDADQDVDREKDEETKGKGAESTAFKKPRLPRARTPPTAKSTSVKSGSSRATIGDHRRESDPERSEVEAVTRAANRMRKAMPSRQSAPIAAQPAPTRRIDRAAVTPRKSSPAPREAIGHRTRPIVQSSGSRGESRRVKTPEAERGEVFAGTASFRLCVKGHRMSKQLAPTDGCWCDRCGTVVNKGDEMLGCRHCNFDLCPDCGRESGDSPRARRLKAEVEMRE